MSRNASLMNDSPNNMHANVFMAVLLCVVTLYFLWWGVDYTFHYQTALFISAALVGLFMAFNIGGNDVANSFGTSVGAGTLTARQALVVAAIFEVSGAVIAGGEVTNTIRQNIVDLEGLSVSPNQFVYVMLSALIAASSWLFFATKKGLPVSTTHAIIGGIIGSSIIMGVQLGGVDAALETIKWDKVGKIALSWFISPMLGGLLAYIIYSQIKANIIMYNTRAEHRLHELKTAKKALKKRHKAFMGQLSESLQMSHTAAMVRDHDIYRDDGVEYDDLETQYYKDLYRIEQDRLSVDSLKALRQWVPLVAAFGGMIMTAMVVFNGLKNADMSLSTLHSLLIMIMIGALVWLSTFIYTKNIEDKHSQSLSKATFMLFSWMQVFTAAGFAFSHGANDVANAIGPFIAIIDVIRTQSIASADLIASTMAGTTPSSVPSPIVITFAIALITGLWFMGKEVIQTVGTNLAQMHPASGFSAELSASTIIIGASTLGLPISSTHVLVGAVLGIGVANRDTNWRLMRTIAMAWIITLPVAAVLSMLCYLMVSSIYG